MKIISTSSWEKITKIAVKEEAKPSCCVRLKTYRGRKKEYKEESVRWSNHNKTEMAQNDLITFPRDLNLPCFSTLTTPKNVLLLPGASFILNKLLFFFLKQALKAKRSPTGLWYLHMKKTNLEKISDLKDKTNQYRILSSPKGYNRLWIAIQIVITEISVNWEMSCTFKMMKKKMIQWTLLIILASHDTALTLPLWDFLYQTFCTVHNPITQCPC